MKLTITGHCLDRVEILSPKSSKINKALVSDL